MTYPTLNGSGITAILQYSNTVSEGYLGVAFCVTIYFVALLYLILRGEFLLDSMVVAGWVTTGASIFLFLMPAGLLSGAQMFIVVASMILPTLVLWYARDKE